MSNHEDQGAHRDELCHVAIATEAEMEKARAEQRELLLLRAVAEAAENVPEDCGGDWCPGCSMNVLAAAVAAWKAVRVTK
jgi:hypothetical protein